MIQSLNHLFQRDLDRLHKEIDEFHHSELWLVKGDLTNSAGNLCLHICGNLQYFIGAVLGNSGYIRKREFEFTASALQKEYLYQEINNASDAISITLDNMAPNRLHEEYPIAVFGDLMSVDYFLIHLNGHLNYHLGQINYLRRMP